MKESPKHAHGKLKKHTEANSEFLSEIPLEDKLWLFWQRYNKYIILGITVTALGFIGYQGISFYKSWQIEKLQNEYRIAHDEKRDLAFAEANPKEPLAGTVFISIGDQFANEQKYDDAIANYTKSFESLRGTPVDDRVYLGVAMLTFIKGDKESGKTLLKELVNNHELLGAIRAEAAYQLVLIGLEEKDYSASKEFLNIILRIPNAGIWEQKANILKDSVSELVSKI